MDLFIDTSSLGVRLALSNESSHFEVFDEKARGEALSALWDQGLKKLEAQPSDLKRILIANGPGSFTGLRVGLAFALGLAMVRNTPIYSVSTLALWGFNELQDEDVLLIPALPGYWFVGTQGFNPQKAQFNFEERLSLLEIQEKFKDSKIFILREEEDFKDSILLSYPDKKIRSKLFDLIPNCPLSEIQANYLQASSAEKMLK